MKNRFLNNIGYTLIELILVASLVGILPISVYLEAAKHAQAASCMSNLRNIYIGVQLYELDYERIPNAKFYPESVKSDPSSIINLLTGYIDDTGVFICPGMPKELQERGLNFIWNDSYNDQPMGQIDNRQFKWLMTEMTAVEPDIPPPHQGAYNILFIDGHVETLREAIHLSPTPADLEEGIKEKLFAGKPKRNPN